MVSRRLWFGPILTSGANQLALMFARPVDGVKPLRAARLGGFQRPLAGFVDKGLPVGGGREVV